MCCSVLHVLCNEHLFAARPSFSVLLPNTVVHLRYTVLSAQCPTFNPHNAHAIALKTQKMSYHYLLAIMIDETQRWKVEISVVAT